MMFSFFSFLDDAEASNFNILEGKLPDISSPSNFDATHLTNGNLSDNKELPSGATLIYIFDDVYEIVYFAFYGSIHNPYSAKLYDENDNVIWEKSIASGSITGSLNISRAKKFEIKLGRHGQYKNKFGEISLLAKSPTVPEGVYINSFVASHDSIDLQFSAVNASKIYVNVDGNEVAELDGKTRSYKIDNLKPKTSYDVSIVAENKVGRTASSISRIVTSDPPPPPKILSFDISDIKDVSARMNFSVTGAEKIEIYRSGEKISEVPSNSVYYVVTTEPESSYELHIVAVSPYGRTASKIITIKTQELFTVPSNLELSLGSAYVDRVNLNFTSKFTDTYKLFRNGSLLSTMPGNYRSFADVQVKPDTEYKYELYAINRLGQTKSEELTVKTLIPPKNDYPKVTISPNSVGFIDFVDVRLFSDDGDAKLYYSFDDEEWLPYKSPLRIKEPKTLYAKAENSVGNFSPVESAHYTLSETPKVLLGISLQDVADSQRSHFNVLWPIIAFTAGIIISFFVGRAIKRLMTE